MWFCERGFDKGARQEGGGTPSIQTVARVKCPSELSEFTQFKLKQQGHRFFGAGIATTGHFGKGFLQNYVIAGAAPEPASPIVYAVATDGATGAVQQANGARGGEYVDDGYYAQGGAASSVAAGGSSNVASQPYVDDGYYATTQPVYAVPLEGRPVSNADAVHESAI